MSILKKLRQKAGLTQLDVARKMGYTSSQFVSNWERGLCFIPPEAFKSVAGLYGITVKDLIQMKLKNEKNRLMGKYGDLK